MRRKYRPPKRPLRCIYRRGLIFGALIPTSANAAERAYGHSVTRKGRWYLGEHPSEKRHLPAYCITLTLIANAQYSAFVAATGRPAPDVDRATWKSYGLVHPWPRTRRHAWTGGRIGGGREAHPVVLVSKMDAIAYAGWLSRRTGKTWRLPTENEWEKAARGPAGL